MLMQPRFLFLDFFFGNVDFFDLFNIGSREPYSVISEARRVKESLPALVRDLFTFSSKVKKVS
jgi:hypothetical protein